MAINPVRIIKHILHVSENNTDLFFKIPIQNTPLFCKTAILIKQFSNSSSMWEKHYQILASSLLGVSEGAVAATANNLIGVVVSLKTSDTSWVIASCIRALRSLKKGKNLYTLHRNMKFLRVTILHHLLRTNKIGQKKADYTESHKDQTILEACSKKSPFTAFKMQAYALLTEGG